MDLKQQLDKAINAVKGVAESDTVRNVTTKARETAVSLTRRIKEGAVNAADTFVQANSDSSALRVRYLGAEVSIVSPADGIQIQRPHGGTIVISDGAGNGLVINAAASRVEVAQTVGTVKRLNDNTYDLGTEDGVNVVVLKS